MTSCWSLEPLRLRKRKWRWKGASQVSSLLSLTCISTLGDEEGRERWRGMERRRGGEKRGGGISSRHHLCQGKRSKLDDEGGLHISRHYVRTCSICLEMLGPLCCQFGRPVERNTWVPIIKRSIHESPLIKRSIMIFTDNNEIQMMMMI